MSRGICLNLNRFMDLPIVGAFRCFFGHGIVDVVGKKVRPRLTLDLCIGPRG